MHAEKKIRGNTQERQVVCDIKEDVNSFSLLW